MFEMLKTWMLLTFFFFNAITSAGFLSGYVWQEYRGKWFKSRILGPLGFLASLTSLTCIGLAYWAVNSIELAMLYVAISIVNCVTYKLLIFED